MPIQEHPYPRVTIRFPVVSANKSTRTRCSVQHFGQGSRPTHHLPVSDRNPADKAYGRSQLSLHPAAANRRLQPPCRRATAKRRPKATRSPFLYVLTYPTLGQKPKFELGPCVRSRIASNTETPRGHSGCNYLPAHLLRHLSGGSRCGGNGFQLLMITASSERRRFFW